MALLQQPNVGVETSMDIRVRECEMGLAAQGAKINTLMDHEGNPGLISKMESRILEKIGEYANQVSDFIKGEPARRQHYDRGWQDNSESQKRIFEDEKKIHLKMHEENADARKEDSAKNDARFRSLEGRAERHEKIVQRGLGVIIFINFVILVMGFVFTAVTFLAAGVWFIIEHVPLRH